MASPKARPFLQPVDAAALGLDDYHEKIKARRAPWRSR